ncbi:MAG: RNA 2'-phosphotransferase [Myxococcota bacterium]|nr:RNA 2'-phosphotransferase [Myxococcota bacterium]
MSQALRHEPWLYELELDEEGWVALPDLVLALRKQGPDWNLLAGDDIIRAVEHSDKKRHEVVDGRIRALYGHSLPGRLKKQAAVPPEWLFHGTSPEGARQILEAGLLPMGRQYVHLSYDVEMALAVGRRKAPTPVLIRVDAQRAAEHGVVFYLGNEKVWLADAVPAQYLVCLDHPSG